jgi:N-acetylated-alpha-linked acidic dipeptidase
LRNSLRRAILLKTNHIWGVPIMFRKTLTSFAIASLLAGSALAQPAGSEASIETRFDAGISSADQLAWLKDMTSEPNQVGSPHDKANADNTLALFKSWGWDAHIETFMVLYPTPIKTTVELVAPEKIKLGGQEPPLKEDATSADQGMLPPYVAYQGDGDVTGDLVYVNYGLKDDYEVLERRGVSVKGKIVIARYGGGWRGLKPRIAEDHGAIGCIIYSDPQDDGYRMSDTYPKGGARPSSGVQRGSVADMTVYPGDPLTPGVGATADAKRLTRQEAKPILKIPALPMSYGDAVKLLSKLGGPQAPGSFAGALPITYHLGGDGKTLVHLAVTSDWSLKPVYDVIATLKGSDYPDQWVVRGNHHDAWVMGASDPLSGNVAMRSEAKSLGALYQGGWRPKRSIVYASWDAEEPMLLGSTEWAEEHAAELKAKAIIYINTDDNGRGFLSAAGSHDFQHLVNDVAKDVTDPETGVSVSDRLRAGIRVRAYDGNGKIDERVLKAAESDDDLPIDALGSGSDFSSYLQHLGLPALNLTFGGEDERDGVYHSIYDSYHHMTTFDDPGLKYGAALSKTVGRLVLRIADADTPPQRFSDFADTVSVYLDEVKRLADDQRKQDETREKLLKDNAFKLASDPLKPVGPAMNKPTTPHVELAALTDAVDRLGKAAKAYDASYKERGAGLAQPVRERLNGLLRDIDQLLLDDRGLPERPWYLNMIYAPGRFTGYDAKTLPGVRESIEERRFDDANVYAGRIAAVLDAYSKRLDEARALIEGR